MGSEFIERVICGEKVYWNNAPKMRDGIFIGFAFVFDDEKFVYISDEHGNVNEVCKGVHFYNKMKPVLSIQPKNKVKYHAIAYKVGSQWVATNISDDTLGKQKYDWEEYRILETWVE